MKNKLIVLTVASLLLLCTTDPNAQTRRGGRAAGTQNATIQTATTEDGRKVILRSDGTWIYADAGVVGGTQTAKSAAVGRQNADLSFDTGLVFKSGDVKPVARATFYLLDDDLENILRSSGFQAEGGSSLLATLALKYVGRELEALRGSNVTTFDKAMEAVKPHIVATTTTDFGGKGQFSPVAPGTYHLMHVGEIGRSVVLWNLKIDLKPGQNSITLDQNNAAEAF
jgi:hypothetical protein